MKKLNNWSVAFKTYDSLTNDISDFVQNNIKKVLNRPNFKKYFDLLE